MPNQKDLNLELLESCINLLCFFKDEKWAYGQHGKLCDMSKIWSEKWVLEISERVNKHISQIEENQFKSGFKSTK